MRITSIVKAASEVFGVEPGEIIGPRRDQRFVVARHAAMYVARRHAGASYPDIGRRMGGRDHTTALHGVRKVEAAMRWDEALAGKIARVAELARAIEERREVALQVASTTLASEIIARAAGEAVERNFALGASDEPPAPKKPASSPPKAVVDPAAALAGVRLDSYPVGSRVWCEIQNARFFRAVGLPYTPSVRVVKIGGVVHGI